MIRFIFAFLAVFVVVNTSHAAEPKAHGKFVSMFDGRTLARWSPSSAKVASAWTVQNGMIVGDGDKGRGYLIYEDRDIADFELTLNYRFPDEGNSGISIRARKDKTGKRQYQCYHADLGHVGIGPLTLGAWDLHTPGRKEHNTLRGDRLVIHKNDKTTVEKIKGGLQKSDIHKGGWNQVRVVAIGNNFKFYINGKLSSEFTKHLPQELRLHKGMIHLQLHDPGMIVHFKDLQIKIYH